MLTAAEAMRGVPTTGATAAPHRIWVALAFWPARVAARKGHSFLGYFIFSLFFFPAALIVAYLVHDRTHVPVTPAAVR